jgi:hypothetical protein
LADRLQQLRHRLLALASHNKVYKPERAMKCLPHRAITVTSAEEDEGRRRDLLDTSGYRKRRNVLHERGGEAYQRRLAG